MIKIRTIISCFVFFGLFFCFCLHANIQINLRALHDDGGDLEQAQAGKPFVLEVDVIGAQKNVSDPQIEGTHDFVVQRTGYRMNLINKDSTINYTYAVRIDEPGSYSIGPAVVNDGDNRVQSRVLLLKVGDHEVLSKGKKPSQESEKMFLRLATDAKQIVAGQKIEGTITFYCRVPDVSLHSLSEPVLEGFTRMDKGAPRHGVETVDGQRYSFVTWRWGYVAKKPGRQVIPSCSVAISKPSENGFYSRFSSFFGTRTEKKRVHSNALSLDVETLPAHAGVVDAVGQFRNFTALLNQAVAREGDGIVLTLALEGDADFENLQLEPQELPHTFKSYSSKQNVGSDGGVSKKSFEFILQGMEPGEWEIPQQTFTYYDIEDSLYKTLKTAPLIVKILSGAVKKKFVPPPLDETVSTAVDTGGGITGTVLLLDTQGKWHDVPERKMPIWLFLLLFFMPLAIWLSQFLRRGVRRYSSWREPKNLWRKAFKEARKQLKRAQKKNDYAAMYRILTNLFAIRCSVTYAQVSDEMIQKVLLAGGLSEQDVREWDRFFAQISSFVFYAAQGPSEGSRLFEQADTWIERLEKIL